MNESRVAHYPFIWWGLVMAPLIYGGLLYFVIRPAGVVANPSMTMVFVGMAVVDVMVAQVLWMRMRRGTLPSEAAGGLSPATFPIAIWALDEGAGVMGLVLGFLGAPLSVSLALIALSVGALLLNPFWVLEV